MVLFGANPNTWKTSGAVFIAGCTPLLPADGVPAGRALRMMLAIDTNAYAAVSSRNTILVEPESYQFPRFGLLNGGRYVCTIQLFPYFICLGLD